MIRCINPKSSIIGTTRNIASISSACLPLFFLVSLPLADNLPISLVIGAIGSFVDPLDDVPPVVVVEVGPTEVVSGLLSG